MATSRPRPYAQFNFHVVIEGGPDATLVEAGYSEVGGLGTEVTNAEYRTGNKKGNTVIKIPTLYKVPDVTLKRGVIGDLATYHAWLDNIKTGQQDLRTVTIELLDEQGSEEAVQSWVLTNARPTKYTGPTLSGKGTDVAIEEISFACEDISVQ